MAELSAIRLTVLVAAAALAMTACGGSSSPTTAASRTVASLPTSSNTGAEGAPVTTSTTATGTHPHRSRPATGNPTALLVQWARCMNAHGDPGQAAPTIDADSVIHMTWNVATPGGIYGTNKGGQGNAGPGQYCRAYIDQAISDLQSALHEHPPSQVQLLRFSQCMRANGVPDFPDPSSNGLAFNRAGDLDPANTAFQKASTLCAKKEGVPGLAAGHSPVPGAVVFNGVGTGGAGG